MKEQVHLALGTSQKFAQLGNFCVKVRDQSMNVYYNMDLGYSKTKVFDLSGGTYKNMETAHHSFHSSGHSHMKEKEGGKKFFKGEICDGSPMNDPDKTLLILGVESFHLEFSFCNHCFHWQIITYSSTIPKELIRHGDLTYS